MWGSGWGNWLRPCATNRKVAGSTDSFIPLADSASNRNEYQEHLLGGEGGRYVEAGNLATFIYRLLEILAALTSWPVHACIGIALPFKWMRLWRRHSAQYGQYLYSTHTLNEL
jgi:hypothetical protein